MTDVLKEAEGRVPTCEAATRAEQAQAVDSVREAIGLDVYTAAIEQLPKIERAIREDYRPWVERITAMATRTGDYPDPIRQAVEAIATSGDAGPRQLREGIAAYEGLRFADVVWKDGRQVDVNQRAWLIGEIRRKLRSHDGLLSGMQQQRAQAEQFIREAGWPRRGVGRGAVGIVPGEPPADLVVETGGGPPAPL